MKILKLIIKSPVGEIIQTIPFHEKGISFIYGDIKEPENKGATINSLGKTLLIKMIDYIFGANEDSSIMKNEIANYVLLATVKFQDEEHTVKRIIGNSSEIQVDGKKHTLGEYKEFFGVERRLYDKQLLVTKKASELSQNQQRPTKNDYTDFLRMLELDNLVDVISNIYDSQDAIKKYKESKKELVSFYGDIDLKQINEEIYFVDKEIKRLSEELVVISNKIKNIEISEVQQNVIEEYSLKSSNLKQIKKQIERDKLEHKRLEEFVESSNKIDIKSEHILAIYEKTKQEIPEMVKRTLEEVEQFHQKVFEERRAFLGTKITDIKNSISQQEIALFKMALDVDKLGHIISVNQVYQESLAIYEKHNNDLQNLKFREGKLSQIKDIDEKIKEQDNQLTEDFKRANDSLNQYSKLVKKYRDYINELTEKIYSMDVSTYFNIEIIKKHTKNRPVKVDLTMRGDTGEGVGEVKKCLIDYLLFNFNSFLEILVQDSACFNGIDPRQVSNMIYLADEIAKNANKQALIAINKYQLNEHSKMIEYVLSNSSIVLSENEKLLKFDF